MITFVFIIAVIIVGIFLLYLFHYLIRLMIKLLKWMFGETAGAILAAVILVLLSLFLFVLHMSRVH